MCWMTYSVENDALANAVIRIQKGEKIAGGHSWGFAYADDGEIVIEKGVGRYPEDRDVPVTDHALAHTRFTTRGLINEENAHPFPIEDPNGEVVAALVHNGTWREAPYDQIRSDTWMMARTFEELLEMADSFEEAFQCLVENIGETIIVLRRDKTAFVYSGRYTITRDGATIASTGFDEIPDGSIVRIEPNGRARTIAAEQKTLIQND